MYYFGKKNRGVIRNSRRRGYTLVELMVSLSIFAFSSTAISSLMFATYNMKNHVEYTTDSTSACEIAMRRIIEVTRSGVDLQYTTPVLSNATTGLYLQTPPDSQNLSYIYHYYEAVNSGTGNPAVFEQIQVSTGGVLTDLQNQPVVDNITSFAVTRLNPGLYPESFQVDLVVQGTPVPISRSVIVTARNLTSGG